MLGQEEESKKRHHICSQIKPHTERHQEIESSHRKLPRSRRLLGAYVEVAQPLCLPSAASGVGKEDGTSDVMAVNSSERVCCISQKR